jgi:hypothetical protein
VAYRYTSRCEIGLLLLATTNSINDGLDIAKAIGSTDGIRGLGALGGSQELWMQCSELFERNSVDRHLVFITTAGFHWNNVIVVDL